MHVLVLLAVGLLASAPDTAHVDAEHRVLRLDFPPSAQALEGFTVCDGGLVLVPVRGGIAVAGWNGWLREPSPEPPAAIQAVTCGVDGSIWVVDQKNRLEKIDGRIADGPRRFVVQLPAGQVQLRAGGDGSMWVLTRSNSETVLARWSEKKGLARIWSGAAKLGGMAAVGRRSLITCGSAGVDLWRPNKAPKRLFALPRPCSGIAADGVGNVFVSTEKGVVQLAANRPAKRLIEGLHGPLVHDGRGLFVATGPGTIYELIAGRAVPREATRVPDRRR